MTGWLLLVGAGVMLGVGIRRDRAAAGLGARDGRVRWTRWLPLGPRLRGDDVVGWSGGI